MSPQQRYYNDNIYHLNRNARSTPASSNKNGNFIINNHNNSSPNSPIILNSKDYNPFFNIDSPQSPSASPINSSNSNSSTNHKNNTLRDRNDISRSFEDDWVYCPRSLLSHQEQITCQKIDLLAANSILSSRHSSSSHQRRFNPYVSPSFSPTSN